MIGYGSFRPVDILAALDADPRVRIAADGSWMTPSEVEQAS